MKVKTFIFSICVFSFLLVAGCSSSADWNSSFVVWNGYLYEVSDEYVTETNDEIGRVTKYSDKEGTYSGNFSNKYKKGTKLYSIKGVHTDEAIAIEEEGKYRKAISNGRYGEK
ncbi:hypothetical protein [Sporosarcina highlanderae]|uniref:Lipoprotein n=1 Tax=Sporosarcina highlanderae TaxID=3035916 RepID=A0ABT8JRW7_9BACL|nr:hypothetical protein [Sporosarcina highlanderae]MDN4607672.1 hypothetical protein [Sporosarcina highlanderae]